MRPDLAFIRDRFNYFNRLCFDSGLPPIEFRLSNSRRSLGCFVYPRYHGTSDQCLIRISSRLDFPVNVVEDILIHEMIHYWIWYNKFKDTSSHGKIFAGKMNEINSRHERHITIRHRMTSEEESTDNHIRNNIICITQWISGDIGITICAQTRIFEIQKAFESDPRIRGMEWFWSKDKWFNKFSISRTPRARLISSDELLPHLRNAVKCVCDGHIFRTDNQKRNN